MFVVHLSCALVRCCLPCDFIRLGWGKAVGASHAEDKDGEIVAGLVNRGALDVIAKVSCFTLWTDSTSPAGGGGGVKLSPVHVEGRGRSLEQIPESSSRVDRVRVPIPSPIMSWYVLLNLTED